MSELITTIIPTFRRPLLLQRAIASVRAQTYADIQICVYDNASGDETESVVRSIAALDSRLTYYRHEQHVEVTRNFLFGMERVATPYFSFLSDDDVLFPEFYASAVSQLHQHPQAVFAAGSVIEFDEDGAVRYAPVASWPREGVFVPPEGFYAMLGNRHPTWTGILFRRSIVNDIGLLDPDVGGPIDLDYELRIAARFPYLISFAPWAAYVHHADRVSAAEDATVVDGYQRISDRLVADMTIDERLRARVPRLLARQMKRKLHEIAFKSVVAGEYTNARDAARLLRSDFADDIVAGGIDTAVTLSQAFPPFRRLLGAVERARLQRRARTARNNLRASCGNDGSAFARYLQPEEPATA